MLRALLIDRFQMKVHMEDRPIESYKLVAVDPRLTKANPASRTGCNQGPAPGGKDPRLTHPVLNMLVTCRNMTMAEIGVEFSQIAPGYIYDPVLDDTGIKGSWDFTLSWSSANLTRAGAGNGLPASGDATKPSDPNGAVTFYDAVSKELGLKLEKVTRPEPVLVIDSIDEQPTAN